MELKINFRDDFSPKLKQDIIEATEWLNKIVESYNYNKAIKEYGFEEDSRIFKELLDGFTLNIEIWHGERERPCKYNKDRDAILLNMNHFPTLTVKSMAGYLAHEPSHEDDRFDHAPLEVGTFPWFTIYKLPKLELKDPFHIRVCKFIKNLFK